MIFAGLIKRFIKPKDKVRIIPPRVSFYVRCIKTGKGAYTGFDLTNVNTTNQAMVQCPCCKQTYNVRIKKDAEVNSIIRIGSKHTFTITNITKIPTTRDY